MTGPRPLGPLVCLPDLILDMKAEVALTEVEAATVEVEVTTTTTTAAMSRRLSTRFFS